MRKGEKADDPFGDIIVILSRGILKFTCNRRSVGSASIAIHRVISINIATAPDTIFRLIELQNVVVAYRNVVAL